MEDWFFHFAEELWLRGDEGADEEARFLQQVLELRAGARVLDAPCGAGRIAIHMARAGYQVTCVDLNSRFINRAKNRFQEEHLPGFFLATDLLQLTFREEFDAVYNWGGSFGYYASEADNLSALERMSDALKPGGIILIDQPNRESLLRNFAREYSTGAVKIQNRWNARQQRLESIWIHNRKGEEHRSLMTMRLYTPVQFHALFVKAGIVWETAYGGAGGSSYRRSSRRLIVVGRKPV